MSRIITFSNQKSSGTFAQIKLDDGKRILISFTKTEMAIFQLRFFGLVPGRKIYSRNISDVIAIFAVKRENKEKTLLQAVVDFLLPCASMQEVLKKLGNDL